MGEFSCKVNNRLVWIDNIKGFMLICIVLSHFGMYPCGLYMMAPLRVSSFFFLSGFLLNTNHNVSFFVKRKFKSLFLPYLLLSLLGVVIDPRTYNVELLNISGYEGNDISYMLGNYNMSIDSDIDFICANLSRIFIEGSSSMITSPLWFLWTLFFSSVFMFAIVKSLDYLYNNVVKIMVLSIVSIASLCIAIYLSAEHEMLILHLDSCSIGLFFMIIGYLVKPLLNLQIKTKYMILVGITLFILYVLYMNISGCLIIYCNVWGRFPVVDAIGTTMGLLMVCVLSKILFFSKELKYVNLVLSYIANNALVILSFHFVIIEYLKIFISPDVIYDSFYQVVYLLLCILILPLLNMLFNDKLRWMIGK